MSIPKVCVMMSTYNGEKFLRRQLESIANQQGVAVELHVRDDGSQDSTVNILNKFSSEHSNISYYSGEKNLGPCGSFFELMCAEHNADYYALSDQDDVWDNNKLLSAVNKLKLLPPNIPALYHSNLRIVDRNEKFIRISHSHPKISGADYSYLTEGIVTGCTAVYNKALAKIIADIKPQNFSMHDTWLYTVSSIFGNVIYDFEPHISYRQHGANVIGAVKSRFSLEILKREFNRYFNWKDQHCFFNAQILKKQFGDMLNQETNQKLDEIINYKNSFASTFRLAADKDFDSESIYRSMRFKIKVLLRNV